MRVSARGDRADTFCHLVRRVYHMQMSRGYVPGNELTRSRYLSLTRHWSRRPPNRPGISAAVNRRSLSANEAPPADTVQAYPLKLYVDMRITVERWPAVMIWGR